MFYYDDDTEHYKELEEELNKYNFSFVDTFLKTFAIVHEYDGYGWLDRYVDSQARHVSQTSWIDDGYGHYIPFLPIWKNYFYVQYYSQKIPYTIPNETQEQVLIKFNRFKKLRFYL